MVTKERDWNKESIGTNTLAVSFYVLAFGFILTMEAYALKS